MFDQVEPGWRVEPDPIRQGDAAAAIRLGRAAAPLAANRAPACRDAGWRDAHGPRDTVSCPNDFIDFLFFALMCRHLCSL
jgi:hypothetical protein